MAVGQLRLDYNEICFSHGYRRHFSISANTAPNQHRTFTLAKP
jgi:hypothetical protein